MSQKELWDLAEKVESTDGIDAVTASAVVNSLRAVFPAEAAAGHIPDAIATSSDAVVALVVAALPGWHFSIHGRARPAIGPWTCSLRQSDVLDDDEVIGTGEAPSLCQALLAAVVRVAALR
jgi:hypothetical protein